jgi:hypothetical protein
MAIFFLKIARLRLRLRKIPGILLSIPLNLFGCFSLNLNLNLNLNLFSLYLRGLFQLFLCIDNPAVNRSNGFLDFLF